MKDDRAAREDVHELRMIGMGLGSFRHITSTPLLVTGSLLFVAAFVFAGLAGEARAELVETTASIAQACDRAARTADDSFTSVTAARTDRAFVPTIPGALRQIDAQLRAIDEQAATLELRANGFWGWTARDPEAEARARIAAARAHVASLRASAAAAVR